MGIGREMMVVGGGDGGVRLWSLSRYSHPKMVKTVREHRGSVSSVSVSEDGEWCLSSSSDGAAILWRLPAMTRTHLLHASSGILGGRLHPNNVTRPRGQWPTP